MLKLDPLPTQAQINAIMQEGSEAFTRNMAQNPPYPTYSEASRLWLRGYSNAKLSKKLNGI